MGARSKSVRSVRRKAQKAAVKAAKKALYKRYAEEGKVKGTKRSRHSAKRIGGARAKGNHAMADCGNVGCGRCYPANYNLKPGLRLRLLIKKVKVAA